MDAAIAVRQQQPGDAVEEEHGRSEDRQHHEDPAHDDRVDADPGGDAGRNAADPARLALQAEAPQPGEETVRCAAVLVAVGAGGVCREVGRRWAAAGGVAGSAGGRVSGARSGIRVEIGGEVMFHSSIVASAGIRPLWGESLNAP